MNCFERCSIRLVAFLLFVGLVSAAVPAHSGGMRIKFATLAPEGSNWMKTLRALDKDLKADTSGGVSFKFYPGGVSGNEKDVIRKMRIGQIHAAGFTGVGLGQILPEVRVLDLPFLFETDQEVESIYRKMTEYFAARFEEKGYVLLGWVPVGWIHFFSQQKIRTLKDLKKTKAWMWEGDPLVQEAYSVIRVAPFALSITDVLTSLQTGLIETVYSSPLGALALQWFSKVKYMSQVRMGYGTGGVLMTKKKFNLLSGEQQAALKKLSARHLERLVQETKRDNNKSVKAILNSGVTLAAKPSPEELKEFQQAGVVIRKNLTGKLFPAELLQQVMLHLTALR